MARRSAESVSQLPNQVVPDRGMYRGFQHRGLLLMQPECLSGSPSLVVRVGQLLATLHHILHRSDPQFRVQHRNTFDN